MVSGDFKYIDIHTHLNFAAYDEDREAVAERAREAGVAMINVGTQKDTSKRAVELAHEYEHCYAAVGLHPVHTDKSFHDAEEIGGNEKDEFISRGEEFDYDFYRGLASDERVVAIGETGLDYYRTENRESRIKQEEVFKKHIELAIEVGKPLMLHVRNGEEGSAYKDALSILNSYFLIHNSRLRANFHFFAGTLEEAQEIIDAGFTVSFTGVITFARQYEKLIKALPLEKIMAETDAPFVAPAAYRGERNEPLYVKEVYAKIARIRKMEEEEVREAINENARRFFGI